MILTIWEFHALICFYKLKKATSEYINLPNNKLSYGAMVFVRAMIVTNVRISLARTATIAAAVWRQFVDNDQPKNRKTGELKIHIILN